MAPLTSQPSRATAHPDPGPRAPHKALLELGLWGETAGPVGMNPKGVLSWTHMVLAAVQAWLQPPNFLWTTTPWTLPKPMLVLIQAHLHLLSTLQPPSHAGMETGIGTVPLASFHAQAVPGLCAALQTSVCFGKVGNI